VTDDAPNDRRRRGAPVEAERDIAARFDELGVDADIDALSLVSNIYRAAAAIRRHMEQTVLTPEGLSWTAFVALWVLWIWGAMETRHLAAEAGVTKGTLTGVVDTLERRGLVTRTRSSDDRRMVSVALTAEGEALIARIYPAFNGEEARVAGLMTAAQRRATTAGLRDVVRGVPELDD
jgi:MarR family transcriptional regulator, organic hydroperoxide resistance regulator